jgi:GMC oxidoreductase.
VSLVQKNDYRTWDEGGKNCWIYNDVSRFFKESKGKRWKNLLEKDSNGNSYRAYSGSLTVEHFEKTNNNVEILDATRKLGSEETDGINAENNMGFQHHSRCPTKRNSV